MKSVDTISLPELLKMAESMYGNLVKAVVDLSNNSMVVDAEMHADEEEQLLAQSRPTYGALTYTLKSLVLMIL